MEIKRPVLKFIQDKSNIYLLSVRDKPLPNPHEHLIARAFCDMLYSMKNLTERENIDIDINI